MYESGLSIIQNPLHRKIVILERTIFLIDRKSIFIQSKIIQLMATKIHCPNCGAENIPSGIFCFECGAPLISKKNNPSVHDIIHEPELEKLFTSLLDSNGYTIISVDKYYVQFLNDAESEMVYFEAVSNAHLPFMKIYEQDFFHLGFQRQAKTNFYKHIAHEDFDISKIMQEIKFIFEKIYKVEFKNYFIHKESDSDSYIRQSNTVLSDSKNVRKYTGVISFILFLLGLLIAIALYLQ